MSKEIYLSRKLMEQNNIPPLDMIEVRTGSIVVWSRVRTRENSEGFAISPDLARALSLKGSGKLRLRYEPEENRIHLGPVIGILAAALPNRSRLDDMEPTSLQAELIYLSRIGKGMRALVYIFLPSGINWNDKTVKGYNYRDRGGWESSQYPLPDVVYNRIASRKSEIKESVQSTLQRLAELEYCQVFNPSYLNKWQVCETLRQNPGLIPHLPETRRLNEENLSYMMGRYGELYLKPSNGSLGIGIIKVRKQADSTFKYTVYSRGRINSNCNSANQLLRKTSAYRKGKPYIVQQGLDLSRYHGSVFDLRVIFQKNGQGEWQIAKKFARVAPGKSSISNLSRGGRVITSRVLMKSLFKRKALIEEKNCRIKELCLKVASTLDKLSLGNFGELGFDIGIDKKGWLWLIEVNSKPRKTTSTVSSKLVMRNTFKRPLEYGSYLAGFPVKNGRRRSLKTSSSIQS
jgi:glutathione synthase/RimK-type ligase-like ATP-grasp enzyme